MSSDPLDSLHEAWRNLDSPSPHADEDALTHATVAWLRGAWSTLEAPGLDLAAARAGTATDRDAWRGTHRLLPWAAAVAAGWLLFVLWLAAPRATTTPEIAVAPIQELPALHAILRDDGSVELRSGVVRLVLVDRPPGAIPGANTNTIPTIPDPHPEPRTTGEDR